MFALTSAALSTADKSRDALENAGAQAEPRAYLQRILHCSCWGNRASPQVCSGRAERATAAAGYLLRRSVHRMFALTSR
jgi:hypothetical protein